MRPSPVIFISFLLLSIATVNPSLAQEKPAEMMSHAIETKKEKILEITLTIQAMVDLLHLNMYEAAIGDLSVCNEDSVCLKHAQRIKNLKCVDDRCNGKSGGGKPSECFEELKKGRSREQLTKLDSLLCPLLNSPDSQVKKELFDLHQDLNDEYLVEAQAYVLAMNGSAEKCEAHIKDFLGEFGPKWDYRWYRALSGCRILARQSTVENEERDFYVWYGTQTKWKCSNIINDDVRLSCHDSQMRAPRLAQDPSVNNIETLINHLYLRTYDVGSNAELTCADDEQCLESANRVKPWLCLAYVCNGKDKTRAPADCFKGMGVYYPGVNSEKINGACNLLRLFDEKDQQTLASYLPGVTTDALAEYAAYMQAVNKSAEACRDFVKRHIGEDHSTWTYPSFRALSGCNILAGELTVEQEEAGYYIWYVLEQKFKCADIKNDALKQACSSPDAASPAMFNEK